MQAPSKLTPRARTVRNAITGISLLACLALQSGSAQAYMLKTTKTGQYVRWSSSTITMRVDPQLEHLLGREEVRAALAMATDAWRGMPGVPQVTISNERAPGYQLAQRTNGIYLMDPWPFPAQQLAVTVSTYATSGKLLGADILVNSNIEFALLEEGEDHGGMKQHDLGAVLTHEMGHVLGLDESPDDQTATMWPYIRAGEVHQRTLTDDDEQGVIAAYSGEAPEQAAGCGQASVVGRHRLAPPTASYGWLILALLVGGFRRRARTA